VSIQEYIKSSFTPYEMAVGSRIFALLFLGIIAFLVWKSAPFSVFAVIFGIYMLLSVGCWYFSRCPSCRKPADTEYFFSEQSRWGFLERNLHFGRFNRLWPDRDCSECRYQLDLFPEQQRG
jgi:hypothetical protein